MRVAAAIDGDRQAPFDRLAHRHGRQRYPKIND